MTKVSDNDTSALARSVASASNNAAWSLLEQKDLSPEQAANLLMLAATARFHWHEVGSDAQKAHADLLFAWALARNGVGPAATRLAQTCLSYFTASGANWELAFAHAAMAAALHADNAPAAFAKEYRRAKTLGADLSGGDAKYFNAAFATLPLPDRA